MVRPMPERRTVSKAMPPGGLSGLTRPAPAGFRAHG